MTRCEPAKKTPTGPIPQLSRLVYSQVWKNKLGTSRAGTITARLVYTPIHSQALHFNGSDTSLFRTKINAL